MRRILYSIVFIIIISTALLFLPGSLYAADNIYLNENGWSEQGIGTWDAETRTAILEKDLGNTTIIITANNLILDGNGKKLNGYNNLENGVTTAIGSKNITIKNLKITNYKKGIYIYYGSSSDNIISDNEISDCLWGIYIYYSSNNILKGNNISDCGNGINIHTKCDENLISGNIITKVNGPAIKMFASSNNIFENNDLSYCDYGMDISYNSNGNKIYHNNFIDNKIQIKVFDSNFNEYNLTEPAEGNYWSDWTAPDDNFDGLVDIPYSFSNGKDNYPFTKINGWDIKNDDIVAPKTIISLSGTKGSNDWYTSDVKVTFSAEDNPDGSGVAKTEYSFDNNEWHAYTASLTLSTEGTNIIYYRSMDNAGNLENILRQEIRIDKTEPEIIINSPENNKTYIIGQNIFADWKAEDLHSGLATLLAMVNSGDSIDTSSAGEKQFSISASDNAGNSITLVIKYTVIYQFNGFLPPLDKKDKKPFKTGGSIPVKFQLSDSNGAYINDARARLLLAKVENNAAGNEIEASSKGNSNELNYFKYDTQSNQYIYNLDTKQFEPGIWKLLVYLDDNEIYNIEIELQ